LKWLLKCDYFPSNYFELWDIYEHYVSENAKLGGKKSGKLNRDNKVGIFGMPKEKRSAISKKVGEKTRDNKIGIFGMTLEEKSIAVRKGGEAAGKKHFENGTGIFAISKEERFAINKKVGERNRDERRGICGISSEERSKRAREVNLQRWQSTVDGFISNAGGVASHNRRIGADPNARVRIA
jgi:hypothetical protein